MRYAIADETTNEIYEIEDTPAAAERTMQGLIELDEQYLNHIEYCIICINDDDEREADYG